MIIKKGKSRLVIVVESLGLVFKFPTFDGNWLKCLIGDLKYLNEHPDKLDKWLYNNPVALTGPAWYFKGIVDNWTECVFYWLHPRQPFLLPVFFSLFGLINIGPIARVLTDEEYKLIEASLFGAIRGEDVARDLHHFGKANSYGIYKGRLVMLDYGGKTPQSIIVKHFNELNKIKI